MREYRALLLLDTKFFYESVIFCLALLLQIFEVGTTIRNHFQKSAARMVVLFVVLQVRCKLIDLLAQDCDLYLRRACVTVVALVLSDDYSLFLDC